MCKYVKINNIYYTYYPNKNICILPKGIALRFKGLCDEDVILHYQRT